MDSKKQKNLQDAMNRLGLTVQDFGLSDISQIGVIPNLADEIIGQANGTDTYNVLSKAYDENEPNLINKTEAVKIVKDIINNPVPFEQKVLQQQAENFGYHNRNFGKKYDDILKPALQETVNFLASKGVSADEIKNTINTKYSVGYGQKNTATHVISDELGSAMLAATVALVAPQLGAGFSTSLGVDAVVGNAIASVAIQTAQGISFDDAVKNATVNAIVNTGSTSVAKDINAAINDPAISNAITSVGASVVKTAALGGSAEDIITNAGAALAASGAETATGDRAIGSAVGGAITGGFTGAVTGAAGALGAEAAKPEQTPAPAPETLVSSIDPETQKIIDQAGITTQPELTPAPVDPVQQFNDSVAQGVLPVNVAQDVQVAAADGSIPSDQTKLGINQFQNGAYATFKEADGSLRSVPVIVDSEGKVYSATGSTADVDFLIKNNVNILRVDPVGLNSIYLDKSPIDPNLSAEEVNALKNITNTRVEISQKFPELNNLLKSYGSLDAAEAAIGLDALTKIPGVMEAINASYVRELEAGLAKDPTYAPYLEEYKNITGRDYSPTAPTIDMGTIEIVGQKLQDVTQPYTPSVIVPDSSLVINVDEKKGKALVMDSKGKVSLVDIPSDIKKDQYVNVDTSTGKATAAKTFPTVTAGTTSPVAPGSETVFKGQTTSQTPISDVPTTPSPKTTSSTNTYAPYGGGVGGGVGGGGGGGGGGQPTSPPSGGEFSGGITDKPTTSTQEPTTKITEKTDTTGGTDSTTGTSKYKPELFIYGGQYPNALSRALGTDLPGGAPSPTTGLTSYRAAGEIEGQEGINRKNVWNEESLRLKDALGL